MSRDYYQSDAELVEDRANRTIARIEAQHEKDLEKLGRVIEARETRIRGLQHYIDGELARLADAWDAGYGCAADGTPNALNPYSLIPGEQ